MLAANRQDLLIFFFWITTVESLGRLHSNKLITNSTCVNFKLSVEKYAKNNTQSLKTKYRTHEYITLMRAFLNPIEIS